MPFGDRTGPLGQGPRTGRGGGLCSGSFGQGGGAGRGRRNWFPASGLTGGQRAAGVSAAPALPDAAGPAGSGQQHELAGLLKSLAERFEAALEKIGKRIEGLESRAKPE